MHGPRTWIFIYQFFSSFNIFTVLTLPALLISAMPFSYLFNWQCLRLEYIRKFSGKFSGMLIFIKTDIILRSFFDLHVAAHARGCRFAATGLSTSGYIFFVAPILTILLILKCRYCRKYFDHWFEKWRFYTFELLELSVFFFNGWVEGWRDYIRLTILETITNNSEPRERCNGTSTATIPGYISPCCLWTRYLALRGSLYELRRNTEWLMPLSN